MEKRDYNLNNINKILYDNDFKRSYIYSIQNDYKNNNLQDFLYENFFDKRVNIPKDTPKEQYFSSYASNIFNEFSVFPSKKYSDLNLSYLEYLKATANDVNSILSNLEFETDEFTFLYNFIKDVSISSLSKIRDNLEIFLLKFDIKDIIIDSLTGKLFFITKDDIINAINIFSEIQLTKEIESKKIIEKEEYSLILNSISSSINKTKNLYEKIRLWKAYFLLYSFINKEKANLDNDPNLNPNLNLKKFNSNLKSLERDAKLFRTEILTKTNSLMGVI